MVINYNHPPKGPIIVPSGVQRQSIMKSQSRYEVPLVVDQSNIVTMHMPLQVMPTVP